MITEEPTLFGVITFTAVAVLITYIARRRRKKKDG